MKLKQRNSLWLACVVAATLLIGIGIQAALAARDIRNSRLQAERIIYELSQTAAQRAAQESGAMQSTLAGGMDRAYENKLKHQEELKKLDLLLLVNPWNTVPEDYVPELMAVDSSHELDARCAEALLTMLDDCRAAGNYPYICSAYRTEEYQRGLYENKILRLVLAGVDIDLAPEIAAQSVAIPGTSEHQLGLAADIIDEFYTNLDEGQENTSTQKWLMENSWRYGFILRYPNGTTDITGIIYEPWHYRYVGEEFAAEIYESGVTLEEYVALRRGR